FSLVKYFRTLANCFAILTYRPISIPDDPQYTSDDVTGVIPSLEGDSAELRETILSNLRNGISRIIIVTIHSNLEKAQRVAKEISSKIQVLSVEHPNKRNQMCEAIPHVTTKITIFADDDVIWPSTMLPWILAPFENPKVGGVGTSQRLKREDKPNFWNFLGAAYLLRRNWDIIACNKIDGGLPCLSGRTVAYRTEIIKNSEFMNEFRNEKWKQYILKADDDNFLTRWLLERGWEIRIQKHRECEVETTLEGNSKFLRQCMRWARSNWRSNLRSLRQGCIFWKHPWSTYAVFQTTLTSWSLPYDLTLAWLWWFVTLEMEPSSRLIARVVAYLWIFLFCRLVKYLEHFVRYPADLIYIPLIPFFGYFHSICIKAYAFFTLNVVSNIHLFFLLIFWIDLYRYG
ncbi:putative polysaccharide synthase Cps1, partial [Microthyrium microscopicum]